MTPAFPEPRVTRENKVVMVPEENRAEKDLQDQVVRRELKVLQDMLVEQVWMD